MRLSRVPDGNIPELFDGLDDGALALVVNAARHCTRLREEVFCRQGESAANLYLLTKGLVKVGGTTDTGKEVLLNWMRPGEAFGLGALLSAPTDYVWTVYSAAPSEALQWDAATINRFAHSSPSVYANALSITLQWARQLQDRFEELSTKMVEQRLAHLVLFLADRFPIPQPAQVPVSHEELAQMIGTTLFGVSRIINRWQRLGYVQKSRNRLLVLDREGLSRTTSESADSHAPAMANASQHTQSRLAFY